MLDRYGVKPEEFCFSIYEDLLPSTVKTFTQDSTSYSELNFISYSILHPT